MISEVGRGENEESKARLGWIHRRTDKDTKKNR